MDPYVSHASQRPMFDPIEFVTRHGVVLGSAHGPVPSIAAAIAGQPIKGSWWAHPKGSEIFNALCALDDCPDVLCFRLVGGKITFVHRRLWPALVRLAGTLGRERVAAIRQEHTASGAHRNVVTAFPKWVPAEVERAARKLDDATARSMLGDWVAAPAPRRRAQPRRPK